MKKGEKEADQYEPRPQEEVCTGRGSPGTILQDLGVMTQDGKIVHAKIRQNSGRSTGSWNLSRIYCRSLIREENLQSWVWLW